MNLSTYTPHIKKHFLLAYPVMLSQLGHMLAGQADTLMVGRLGAKDLAAASLANSIFGIVMMFGIGVSMAVTPLVATAHGENDNKKVATIFKHGVLTVLITALLLFVILLLGTDALRYMNQPDEVVQLAIPYSIYLSASLLPLMVFQAFKQFAEGLSDTKWAMYISVGANLLNICMNFVFIYGKMGFPAMGLNGAGLATLIARLLMALAMVLYVYNAGRFQKYWQKVNLKGFHRQEFRKILNIGLPTGFQFIFEVGAFSAAAIMTGWIGTHAQAAHQIAISLGAVTYMMASGIGAAATVRVGNLFGGKDIADMRIAGFVAFGMGILFMAFMGGGFLLFKDILPHFYVTEEEVIGIASSLLIIAAFFQVSDGVQVVGLGALRGMGDVKVPTIFAVLAYWVVGLPVGYLLGFTFNMEAEGIWYGLLIGLSISGCLMLLRFHVLSRNLKLKTSRKRIVKQFSEV
ncbi:MATE family efflux transporter [Xanthovirga aplysinae]|uniref:MATE family efflux transporter n=1 Tax=Xanthovirga aplysinae TaxID=2529853 RepID=UPI0012BD4687|nr:MATE family efflux transporter [Xanthovirga aplysinae]MTI33380.1 MATE family efflux transporter [Xanthovirga aplysinae]